MADTLKGTTGNMMTALFRYVDDADNGYQELLRRGYSSDDMSI